MRILKVLPPLAFFIARATATVRRPVPITTSGQGGLKSELPAPKKRNGAKQKRDGKCRHGQVKQIRFCSTSKPNAWAKPSDWLSIPGIPNVNTQQVSAFVFK